MVYRIRILNVLAQLFIRCDFWVPTNDSTLASILAFTLKTGFKSTAAFLRPYFNSVCGLDLISASILKRVKNN